MRIRHLFIVVGVLLLAMTGCRKEEVYVEMVATDVEVIAVFTPQGLGDRSYVDMMYIGLYSATNELNISFHPVFPKNTQAGVDSIVKYATESNPDKRRLVVVTDYIFTHSLHDKGLLGTLNDDEFTKVLFVSSNPQPEANYTVCVDVYGLMYEAGYMAQAMENVSAVQILLASNKHPDLQKMRKGFVDGFISQGKDSVNVQDLRTALIGLEETSLQEGYLLQEFVYRSLAREYVGVYDMVVPICGESINGFLRYTRENPNSYYVLGVDVDMSMMSEQVPFSCVKHMDKILNHAVKSWYSGTLERVRHYGLEGQWVEIVISDNYKAQLEPVFNEIHATALELERTYEH